MFSSTWIEEVIETPSVNPDTGEATTRKNVPSDHFPSPFANEVAARAANNNALPPDLSLITKARHDGPNYLYSLIGPGAYRNQPAELVKEFPGSKTPPGLHYNPYFANLNIAMPPPLTADGQVTYTDGTRATHDQMSRDVAAFLTWTAEPKLESRHAAGFADTDTQSEEKQLAEVRGSAAQRGEGAPDGNCASNHLAAAGAVGQHRQWHAKHRVENGERNSADRPELGIGQLEIVDDRTGKNAEDLPVEEIEDIGKQQKGQDDIGARLRGRVGLLLIHAFVLSEFARRRLMVMEPFAGTGRWRTRAHRGRRARPDPAQGARRRRTAACAAACSARDWNTR